MKTSKNRLYARGLHEEERRNEVVELTGELDLIRPSRQVPGN